MRRSSKLKMISRDIINLYITFGAALAVLEEL